MRIKKPYVECRFCGQVPKQLLLYDGFSNGRRFYRCGLCKSSIRSEKVTQNEVFTGKIDDLEFCGELTTYGYRYGK